MQANHQVDELTCKIM